MNKDLAELSAVWRVLFEGAGLPLCTAYRLLFIVVKEPPKMVLRRILGPSLETGTVFDAVLSVNYCANCDSVSVRAVQEKCDEKRLGTASRHRSVRCRTACSLESALYHHWTVPAVTAPASSCRY